MLFRSIHLYQSVVSVIRRLPDDILRTIFLTLMNDMKDIDIMTGAWPSLCSLSQVSQRWRAVALFTPPLWANICGRSVSYKYDPSLINSVILICLSRARNSPLHVSLRLYGRDSQADAQSVFEGVRSKASRWKHFSFTQATSA